MVEYYVVDRRIVHEQGRGFKKYPAKRPRFDRLATQLRPPPTLNQVSQWIVVESADLRIIALVARIIKPSVSPAGTAPVPLKAAYPARWRWPGTRPAE